MEDCGVGECKYTTLRGYKQGSVVLQVDRQQITDVPSLGWMHKAECGVSGMLVFV